MTPNPTPITISQQFSTELRMAIEDAVSYVIDEARKEGELVSGETAYKMVECIASAKQAEFQGQFD